MPRGHKKPAPAPQPPVEVKCICPASIPVPVGQFFICQTCGNKCAPPSKPVTKPGDMSLASALSQPAKPLPEPSYVPPHEVVTALAGCGKTTTLVSAIEVLKGITPTVRGERLVPSPQQEAVWDAVALSKRSWHKWVCFAAFNKSIADELKSRVPPGCDAKTMHGMGFGAVKKTFQLPNDALDRGRNRVEMIIQEVTGFDIRVLRKEKPVLVQALKRLTGFCKQNLTDPADVNAVAELIQHFEVDVDKVEADVQAILPRVIHRCLDVQRDGCIDYNDMIWLPVALNLQLFKYDVLFVDEAQDLNRCQHELVKRSGRRLVVCGDPNQAIYGFAGADSDSMPRLQGELKASQYGCQTHPLTVTRRCCKAVVKSVKAYVPEFEAHESNPEGGEEFMAYPIQPGRGRGEIKKMKPEETYLPHVKEGDMVICRKAAPIVSQYFMLIRRKLVVAILGKNIGEGIIEMIERMMVGCDPKDWTDPEMSWLRAALETWLEGEIAKENAKKFPSEALIEMHRDKYEAILEFMNDAASVNGLIPIIESAFTIPEGKPYVRMSTVHKAKGLEADTVFFLDPLVVPSRPIDKMKPWQQVQERNLQYVGRTRAINRLVHVN